MLSLLLLFVAAQAESPPVAAAGFTHALLEQVVSVHVDAAGNVDYKAIAADRATLDAYVAAVAAVSPALFPTKNDALAYYINAYNALAITGVIDRPGLKSVEDNLFGFFYGTKYALGKKKMSLYDLENRVVRKVYADPRVHFALNCQSAGCPRLPQHAFTAAGLDAELDAASREFANNPAKVNAEGGVAHLSQICEWYAEDFKAAGGAVAFMNTYGAALPADAKVAFIPYDWSLSAQAGRGP